MSSVKRQATPGSPGQSRELVLLSKKIKLDDHLDLKALGQSYLSNLLTVLKQVDFIHGKAVEKGEDWKAYTENLLTYDYFSLYAPVNEQKPELFKGLNHFSLNTFAELYTAHNIHELDVHVVQYNPEKKTALDTFVAEKEASTLDQLLPEREKLQQQLNALDYLIEKKMVEKHKFVLDKFKAYVEPAKQTATQQRQEDSY